MLKRLPLDNSVYARRPAAFRRLCVETMLRQQCQISFVPAAFRRLCVETGNERTIFSPFKPAAFRRLCVETKTAKTLMLNLKSQPPSGGCVLKLRPRICPKIQ